MTQDALILLLFKVALIADLVMILAFCADYSRLAPWWGNPIGRTLVIKDLLLVVILIPAVLSLFFHFSRLTSRVSGWIDVAAFGLIVPVMAWRILVFERVHKEKLEGEREQ